MSYSGLARVLTELARDGHRRGWMLGTSGNFSAVASREPFRMVMTPTGVDKGQLRPEQMVLVDAHGGLLRGSGRPSSETPLHLAVVCARQAGAVLHTHSIWSTILPEGCAKRGGVSIKGYEMLKGLEGVHTHEHQEWLPILENSQDVTALATKVGEALERFPDAHGFLLRRHGLYTWGDDFAQAKRHLEILEFLLEVIGRSREVPAGGSEPVLNSARLVGGER